MKICMLTSSFPRYTGDYAGPFIYQLAHKLVQQNVKVYIVTPTDENALPYEIMDGIYVHRFQYMPSTRYQRLTYHNGGIPVALHQSWLAWFQIIPFILAFLRMAWRVGRYCDIFHAHWTLAGLVAVPIAKLQRKPIVLTAWGADINLVRGPLLKILNRALLANMNSITAVSEDLKRKIIELGLPERQISILPNAVDEQSYIPMPQKNVRNNLNLPKDNPIILFVGSLIERKGLSDLISAMPDVLQGQPQAKLYIVGNGYLEPSLRQQAETLNLEQAICFVSAQPPTNIPLWMNAADIFVLPSYSEGRPTVILEAFACETVVVASNIGGNCELVIPGKTGLLAQMKNPTDFAEKLLILLNNVQQRQIMAKQTRQFIIEQGFTWQDNAKRLLEIYRNL